MMMPARCLARFLSRVVCSLHTSAAWLPWAMASAHRHIHQDRLDGKPSNGTSGSQVPWPNGRAKCEEPRVAYHSRRYHTHPHTHLTLSLQLPACGMRHAGTQAGSAEDRLFMDQLSALDGQLYGGNRCTRACTATIYLCGACTSHCLTNEECRSHCAIQPMASRRSRVDRCTCGRKRASVAESGWHSTSHTDALHFREIASHYDQASATLGLPWAMEP